MSWNPTIGTSSRFKTRSQPGAFRLFLTIGWLGMLGIAFIFGYQLAYHDVADWQPQMRALQKERERLQTALLTAEETIARLEQAHAIDREAQRVNQEQLTQLQQERHELVKRVTALERLVNKNDAGIIHIREFQLWQTKQAQQFDYHFTVTQLVPDFSKSQGQVKLTLFGSRADADSSSSIALIVQRLTMDFKHFQSFNGTFVLDQGDQPDYIVIEIEPVTKRLLSSQEKFLWQPQPNPNALLSNTLSDVTATDDSSLNTMD
jgi:hypothetical protein